MDHETLHHGSVGLTLCVFGIEVCIPNIFLLLYLRNEKEYKPLNHVYGIWQYKVLSVEKLFQSEIIWGENNIQNLHDILSMNKSSKAIDISSSPYQTYTPTVI